MSRTTSRRRFLQTSAVATGAALAGAPAVHAAGGDLLRVGLIGCGGRGTGAAAQALRADKNVKLTAMGDAFSDRLEDSLKTLAGTEDVAAKLDVPPDRRFVGFDAYKRVIAASDVVLLTTPPHFRPLHLKAAIDAGRHVFAEKPCAVDAPGVRSVLATCEEAKKKNLAVVSGLCLRYDAGFREIVKRLHAGAIGDVVALQANDLRTGRWAKPRQPGQSDMLYQMRNWYNYTWLSGDFNVEQHVHFLDVAAWIMGDQYPVRATGLGGRQVLTGPEYGHVYDHFFVTYEYANGAKLFSQCRQQPKTHSDMSVQVLGTKGRANVSEKKDGHQILGPTPWRFEGPNNELYQQEHDELFASIRAGTPINNGEYMAKSSLLAIMGRMAAYTGQVVTWQAALNSEEDLSPPKYDWDAALAEPPVATPGKTRFV